MKIVNGIMTCIFAFTLSSHVFADTGSEDNNSENSVVTLEKRLDASDSEKFMNAMASTGVVDETGMDGLIKLKASNIQCTQVVYPNAKIKCMVQANDKHMTPKQDEATVFMDVIKANGGRIRTGMGIRKVVAMDVVCSKAVVMNPVAHCSLKVLAPN